MNITGQQANLPNAASEIQPQMLAIMMKETYFLERLGMNKAA